MGVISMKAIKYVGLKAYTKDTVAGTGLFWEAGETHNVPDAAAERLLRHPDVWALDEEVTTVADAPGPETIAPEGDKPVEEEENFDNPPPQNLEAMTKADISAYAMREFNLSFKANDSKTTMIDAISNKLGGKKFE